MFSWNVCIALLISFQLFYSVNGQKLVQVSSDSKVIKPSTKDDDKNNLYQKVVNDLQVKKIINELTLNFTDYVKQQIAKNDGKVQSFEWLQSTDDDYQKIPIKPLIHYVRFLNQLIHKENGHCNEKLFLMIKECLADVDYKDNDDNHDDDDKFYCCKKLTIYKCIKDAIKNECDNDFYAKIDSNDPRNSFNFFFELESCNQFSHSNCNEKRNSSNSMFYTSICTLIVIILLITFACSMYCYDKYIK